MASKKTHVLFICTHNSCRSQMAEGILNHVCSDYYQAYSGGIEKTRVHPLAIQVMNEIDIDITNHYSKHIDEFKDKQFDIVVTVCDNAKETCPFFPGKNVIHKSFVDPGTVQGTDKKRLCAFRQVRDEIKQWILNEFCDQERTFKQSTEGNNG